MGGVQIQTPPREEASRDWDGITARKLRGEGGPSPPVCGAERDSRAQWAAFKASHPEALNEEVLDLLDRCNLAAAWERDAAFCLGLQLGLELGGLGRFWDTEP